MPAAEFFTRLGLFVRKNFLEQELCARCYREMDEAPPTQATQATIAGPDGTDILDEAIRRVTVVDVPDATVALVEAQMLALLPALERHFNVTLTGCQPLQFLTYREGDFYAVHNDSDTGAPGMAGERKVSLVLFLNSPAQQPADGAYGGGSLTFYNLIADPQWQTYGFPLNSEAGLLVAFRSDMLHQVLPVTHGKRYTIVSWLF